jgi:protein SCO1/2
LQREFGPRGVHFVSITCDPKHDTPKQLADYSRVFTSEPQTWHFLTGDLDLIKRIGNHRLGIAVDEQVHSDRLVIFDRDGNLVGTYSTTKRDELLKAQQALEDLLASV